MKIMAIELIPWEDGLMGFNDWLKSCTLLINNMYSQCIRMLTINPFTGGSIDGLIDTVHGAVNGIALSLCTLFFLMEFCRKSFDLQWVKWENVLMFCLKFLLAKVIIDNSMEIMTWIFDLFNNLALDVNASINGEHYTGESGGLLQYGADGEDAWRNWLTEEEHITYRDDGGFLGLSRWLKEVELLPMFGITMLVLVVTGVIIFGRMFEVVVYTMAAPVPLSTFASEEHKQIGVNFIKNYAAVCLQALMIILMFALFSAFGSMLETFQGTLVSGSWGLLMKVLVLGIGIFKSGNWAKKLCGAM